MKQTYYINGMTCGSCKASIEKYLNEIENVSKVFVNLQKGAVEVTMEKTY